jgi:hypothetical protein
MVDKKNLDQDKAFDGKDMLERAREYLRSEGYTVVAKETRTNGRLTATFHNPGKRKKDP